jgi:hypothetical protein
MLAICWTLYTVAGLVVATRVYTQLWVTRQFGYGDIWILSAVVNASNLKECNDLANLLVGSYLASYT